ncbi:SDR family NAD(P)-dependent oxidoreductase [Ramlibacter henchirensis]|uniref:SDR family NAD(P)-dependent oxidoreductase n=1 Tax=Ramlibacter henchirensis TaxID=204072 RepID=A0A4Z0C1J6_9BURK|nr:SDR family NAD(P)-dependent oxidoreductase [Ramlibacter henchirensis]TFZ05406.1 SDR family NAD(P)-dependent oxidoreductase [Ramlibacter henchirensis]
MNALEGQIAVVTGASRGIGEAIALALAERGATLCLVGRNRDSLQAVLAATRTPQRQHRCYASDLAIDDQVDELAAVLERDLPAVHILVHAAGALEWGPFENSPAHEFDSQYRTNVRAPYVLTQRLLPRLKAAQGQVVFVNSSAGLSARANVAQYAATKHALKAVADSLREEVNADGVRVMSLFVGRTATRMQAQLHAVEGKAYDPASLIQPEDVAALAVHALSLPRTVEVTEIALRPLRKPA